MAVEARRLSLFPPQILDNREFVVEGNGNVFGAPIGHLAAANSLGISSAAKMYSSALVGGFQAKTTAMKSDSGLAYAPVLRKRPRESTNSLVSVPNQMSINRCGGSFTFLGEDISGQIQQQQLEIDRFIAQHTETVRTEIDERRKQYSRRVAAAVEENVLKKLKAKEEEIEKIGKLNFALEEKVKSLCMENQIWRDLAQSHEAAANALRCNLEQVLALVEDEKQRLQRNHGCYEVALVDDAESSCGSNSGDNGGDVGVSCGASRMCRGCGGEESCVLLLPCRHLCLCTVCSSALHQCPICKSPKTASLHVNLSFS